MDNMNDIELFNNWTSQDEENALKQAKASTTIKHIIKNNEFWALAPGGKVYKLPINLSIADFTKLSEAQKDTDQFRVFKAILEAFAGVEQAHELEHEPFIVVSNILSDYGETLAKIQGTDLGKSQTSVDSLME
ncbi:hypothetical protein QP104_07325 [Alloscardovia omnicolens]|uniref:hypothetical protein n=1 Tax=Alloscardovia omnicolens TaxID=419015 RepID=UPI00254DF921|nr:hypothetical protein [Alloscardovia omnicolens]MDK6445723.1 hypothetical protein [Alloscardovia omnicolens]